MKKKRIIIAAILMVIELVIISGVTTYWALQNCNTESLIFEILWYSAVTFLLWYIIDEIIKEKNKK